MVGEQLESSGPIRVVQKAFVRECFLPAGGLCLQLICLAKSRAGHPARCVLGALQQAVAVAAVWAHAQAYRLCACKKHLMLMWLYSVKAEWYCVG